MGHVVDNADGGRGDSASSGPIGISFIASSTRNHAPRVISNVALAAVLGAFVGPFWAVAWFALAGAGLFLSHYLVRAIERAGHGPAAARYWAIMNAATLAFSAVQCAPMVALWWTGQPLAMSFALVSAMIGCTYVLLHYYADVGQYRIFLAPYAAALLLMAGKLVADDGFSAPAWITFLACAVTMVNFLHYSREMLDRSRAALRQARARAQENERDAQAANRAKSAFLATMSHEIRTPLNGVLGMAQAMAAGKLSAVQRERLSVIHQSGESLLAILNDILDLSKIEAGKLDLENIEFDLDEVARGAYSAFTALANKKGLSFALDIEAARGRYRGDPTRLRQILYNLISNALKFTEEGEIRVSARLNDAGLEFSVRDTGMGISPDNLCRLFAKFDQLDSSTTRRFGGTGLGLSICRELAQLMGGDITVESALGAGSTFTLRVPLPRVGEAKAATQLVPEPPAADAARMSLRVLAAEDNSVNQLVLKTLLHQLGIEPTVVEDGQAAVDAWEAAPWDLILMDIQMPVMDGLAAAATIRAREAVGGRMRTPIIALTANAMAHQVEQYLAAGMDTHVAKPIEAAALFAALSATTASEPERDAKPAGRRAAS